MLDDWNGERSSVATRREAHRSQAPFPGHRDTTIERETDRFTLHAEIVPDQFRGRVSLHQRPAA